MTIKVMTFNLRLSCDSDGINNFYNRKDNILRAIRSEHPDIIGLQEATQGMRDLLRDELSDTYVIIGGGRNNDYRGEGVCIAYRRDIFELVSFDTFWLSDTPSVAGSRYENTDQSHCPRVTVCAELSPSGSDQTFRFFNTHLDHKGEIARVKGMKQIVAEIEKQDGTFILTGDMNAFPDSECISVVRSMDGVVDTTAEIPYTFHDFGRYSGCKIDYIFTNGTPIDSYALPDEHKDGVYISDHFPVCSVIEIL